MNTDSGREPQSTSWVEPEELVGGDQRVGSEPESATVGAVRKVLSVVPGSQYGMVQNQYGRLGILRNNEALELRQSGRGASCWSRRSILLPYNLHGMGTEYQLKFVTCFYTPQPPAQARARSSVAKSDSSGSLDRFQTLHRLLVHLDEDCAVCHRISDIGIHRLSYLSRVDAYPD